MLPLLNTFFPHYQLLSLPRTHSRPFELLESFLSCFAVVTNFIRHKFWLELLLNPAMQLAVAVDTGEPLSITTGQLFRILWFLYLSLQTSDCLLLSTPQIQASDEVKTFWYYFAGLTVWMWQMGGSPCTVIAFCPWCTGAQAKQALKRGRQSIYPPISIKFTNTNVCVLHRLPQVKLHPINGLFNR